MKLKKIQLKDTDRKYRIALFLVFSLIIFVALFITLAVAIVIVYVFVQKEILFVLDEYIGEATDIILFMGGISLILGTVTLFIGSRFLLKPINKLINHMNRLASGDFKTRLTFGNLLYKHPTFVEISNSFNTMAEELENTEILRGDFINNFSHEFKTPIVSIAGFAKLLKKGNLSEAERQQYLDVIEDESMRLSYMATNVLNLTKVENQTILSDVSAYNLSEQIRSVVVFMEGKWSKKDMDLQLDFDEYTIQANRELLQEVWLNLFDNAVKFAPRGGTVAWGIQDAGETIQVRISNTGADIPPEKQEKIFQKFYQADESHATQGNGIGLAIVKRIVELHNGQVSVHSENGITTFTVELPKKQQ